MNITINSSLVKYSIIILISFLHLLSFNNSFAESKISKINVIGNKKISYDTIVTHAKIEKGDNYNNITTDKLINNIYSTGFFSDVSINFDDKSGTLNIKVVETPLVSNVKITGGNNKIKTELKNDLMTMKGYALSPSSIELDKTKITEFHKKMGYFNVRVEHEIIPNKSDNDSAEVIFKVQEGKKVKINKIYFAGNNSYTDSELRDIITTKQRKFLNFFTSSDIFDSARIEYDKYLLEEFYNSVGFKDFRVISTEARLSDSMNNFTLIFSIEEGKMYKFGNISLKSNIDYIDLEQTKKIVPDYQDKTFNKSLIEKISNNISDNIIQSGNPQAKVTHKLYTREGTNIVDVVINIDQAEKYFVNKINITGNVKTEDNVIRRQFHINEDDVFNQDKIRNGERRIHNLNYFKSVKIEPQPIPSSNRADVNVKLEEKSTSSASIQLGYNTSGGMFTRLGFDETNFVGTGRSLNAHVQFGKKSSMYSAGLLDPNFMDKNFALGGNVFYKKYGSKGGFENDDHSYDLTAYGFSPSIGYRITDNLTHNIEYNIKKSKLSSSKSTKSIFVKEQLGKYTTSSIENSLTYDSLDNGVVPKNGYLLMLSYEYAGIGGNIKHHKYETENTFYKSFLDQKLTLKFKARAGYITGVGKHRTNIDNRFNLGDFSLRGFEAIGPRDKTTAEVLGGKTYYNLTTELIFPIVSSETTDFSGALFIDAGALWGLDSKHISKENVHDDKSLRSSYGFGFRWLTPIAPINMYWGYPIHKKKYDKRQVFNFIFTTNF